MRSPDLLDGCCDDQCDRYPVSLALYRRRPRMADDGVAVVQAAEAADEEELQARLGALVKSLTSHLSMRHMCWSALEVGFQNAQERASAAHGALPTPCTLH